MSYFFSPRSLRRSGPPTRYVPNPYGCAPVGVRLDGIASQLGPLRHQTGTHQSARYRKMACSLMWTRPWRNSNHRTLLSKFRPFSTSEDVPEGGEEEKTEKKAFGFPVPKLPPGYNPHKPPPCAAWDLSCHTWKTIDRGNTAVT